MKYFCVLVCFLWAGFVFGADVRVVGAGSDQAVPVSLRAFSVESDAASALFLQTLHSNLDRWGWFRVTDGASEAYALQGRAGLSGRSFVVTVEAVDARTGRAVYSERFREDPADARAVALRLQDGLTEAIHRVPGIASTRIAFAGSVNGSKDLYLIAADGQDLVQLTRDGVPCFRPAWSPDAKSLFYTS
jgi:Tol biopolymer transport system component